MHPDDGEANAVPPPPLGAEFAWCCGAAGLPLTCEVNAHHLTWADDDVPLGGTLYKCMPPLRDRANLEGLWDGLKVRCLGLPAGDERPPMLLAARPWSTSI